MKIAVVVTTFPPYHGGMGNVAEAQGRLLVQAGHEVTVFTTVAGAAAGGYVLRRLRPLLRIGNGALIPQLFWRLRGFDAVLLHWPAFGLLEAALVWRAIFGHRSRFFVYYHMDAAAAGVRGLIFALYNRMLLPLLLRAADLILVSSRDYAAQGLLGKAPEAVRQKIREIPLAVDTEFFSPGGCGSGEREHFGLAEKNILFVGGMDRAHDFKGVPILLSAFAAAAIPDARVHLVGDGELRESYERQAQELGLATAARFHGRLKRDELLTLYRCSGLLVLPSLNQSEAFGLTLLEAMAAGKPVIASNLPGVRTVVTDDVGWLAPPGDTLALARLLEEVWRAPERLLAKGQAARRRVLENYSLECLRRVLREII
ncbi:glycosyltransferase family 1 protein [Patescibacteria group bacterium]|nr:MAG: glycosyltransferase family 1 protein [Patescibacteria group bacterium]